MTYLESYGPLAVLMFLRSQEIIKTEAKLEAGYARLDQLTYVNTYDCHDYIKFLVKVLQFYMQNFELATKENDFEAF